MALSAVGALWVVHRDRVGCVRTAVADRALLAQKRAMWDGWRRLGGWYVSSRSRLQADPGGSNEGGVGAL